MCRLALFDVGRLALMSVALVTITPSALLGQLTDVDRTRLASEIDAAAQNLDPDRFPDLESAKEELLQRMQAADDFLIRRSPLHREGWLKYLDLQPLREAIEADGSIATIGREAIALRFRMIGTAPGLELDSFVALRESVANLIEAIRFRDKDRSTAQIAKQLETLSQKVRELDDSPSSQDIATITAILRVLDSAGQASGAVTSLRNKFSRPNVAVLVGESLVQQVVHQDVNQSRPVRDCILGTRIVGTATMTGVVTANLLPAIGTARIQVSLTGHVVSNNTGYNGPIRLRTASSGNVNVSRTVHFNESGVNLEPAHVRAELRSEIRSIQHHMRLVRNIARKRAAEQKPRADRIAVNKMRLQVGRQFTEQTDQAGAFTPPERISEIRPMLKRLSLREPARLWGSTDDNLFIDTTFRGPDQLATVVSRPPIMTSYDVAIQLHESVINNAFSPILAGRTMNESQVNKLLDTAGRPVPAAEEGEGTDPPFEIDFARLQPIVFSARDQTIRIGIRGTRFKQGRRELKRAMEIAAIYQPATTPEGKIILLRDGEVDVDFPGNRPLTISQAGLKPTIKKKFVKVFPEVLLDRPLEIPTTANIAPLRGRVFHPRLVDANNGWLTIAVR